MTRKRRNKPEAAAEMPSSAMPRLRLRTKLLFSLVAVALSLLILEGASRVLVGLTPNARWQYRSTLATTLGFPALNEIFVPDEGLFWAMAPNLEGHVVEGRFQESMPIRFRVTTDANGFRRMPTVDAPRQRVLFLGDSCTFGLGVDDHETFPAIVQDRLSGVRCINAAASGYTAYQGRRLLEQLQLQPQPDAAVITFGRNDDLVWDHLSDLEHAKLIEEERARLAHQFRSVELIRQVLPRRNEGPPQQEGPPRPRLTDEEYVQEMTAIVQWCRRRDIEPILIVWPFEVQMRSPGQVRKQALVLRLANQADVRLVDLVPVFRAGGGSSLFLDVVHANARGCELVADTLLPVLQDALADRDKPDRRGAVPTKR